MKLRDEIAEILDRELAGAAQRERDAFDVCLEHMRDAGRITHSELLEIDGAANTYAVRMADAGFVLGLEMGANLRGFVCEQTGGRDGR